MSKVTDSDLVRELAAQIPGGVLGDANKFGVRIASVTLGTERTEVELPAVGVTAVVGANNSGKSTVLRQLQMSLTDPGNLQYDSVHLVGQLRLVKEGTGADFIAWLSKNASYTSPPRSNAGFSRSGASNLLPLAAARLWEHGDPNELQSLAPFLVQWSNVQTRFSNLDQVQQRGDVSDAPSHPLHHLQDDAVLFQRLDELFYRIFRESLTLDDLSGSMKLRLGRTSVPVPAPQESQGAYRAALSRLSPLMEQGDGMKSLVGLLLPLVTATYPIVVVDEPEAFLHPPQALALGRALGELASQSRLQVILATHDRNILTGLLVSETPLSVIRLAREGSTTSPAQLSPERLLQLWSDPVLRYSNVLDGLFHRLVILAEAEQDCRFYAAALDAAEERSALDMPPSDVLFLPSNGKEGMSRLVTALRQVAVPIVASPDLDILNDETVLSRLVESLDHDWSNFRTNYRLATEQFRRPRQAVLARDVRDAVSSVLDQAVATQADRLYDAALSDSVLAALRMSESPWRALKDYGDRAFRGQSASAAEGLLNALDEIGLVAVRVGELEGFAPTLGVAKGKGWLPAALEAGAHRDVQAQSHVDRLMAATR